MSSVQNSSGEGKLKRQLGFLDLTFLGLGAIIGSGWLFASQGGAQLAGPTAWVAWVIGAVAVGLIGLVYAELSGALPRAGGIIRYPDYSHGPIVGFLMGIAALVAYSSVAGIEAEAMRGYAQTWWKALGTSTGGITTLGWFVQFILLIVFFLINYWSVNIFGKVNSVVTAIKFIVPLLTIIVLLTHVHGANFSNTKGAGGFTGIESAVSTAGIIFAFLGFRQAVDFAGEAKNPQKNVPLAIITAIAIGAVLYILLQITFIGALTPGSLSGGWAALNYKSPFADLARALGMAWLANVLFADAVLSPSGTGNIYLSSTARVIFAWARTGTFFKVFSRVSPKNGVPRPALWLAFILSVFWTLPFPTWGALVGVVSSATVMTYIIGPISAAALRRTASGIHRPFRLGGMGVIAPIAFIVASLIIYWTGWKIDSWLIGLQLAAFVLYLIINKVMPSENIALGQQIKSTSWLIVYYIVMFLVSKFGDKAFGGCGALKTPVDQIIVVVIALIAYYWGVAAALPKANITEEHTEEDAGSLAAQPY
ncbi:APC family permease [Alicyclobacillus ferrooxydans]|uniref:Aspartate:proton symporter n=1 Tax=Alicyclobacillus ferrooxydans TaxID=471514 RepID=A0A0P9ELY6_9BACL|nr:APC family permease [Alicyclobacillus ferrooxydans]KPV44338.1 aspartate:proton symporter [Alicyclobacillus ferrooxydans]